MGGEALHSMKDNARTNDIIARLRRDETVVWFSRGPARVSEITEAEIADARARFDRFASVLSALFPDESWDGRIVSPLLEWRDPGDGLPDLLIKADHQLPITGTIKARGGLHEVLCWIEDVAGTGFLFDADGPIHVSLQGVRRRLGRHKVVVASTGNLGFSIGRFARAFGAAAEVHMSRDAKDWKKTRLAALGAEVIEHDGDYSDTVAAARRSADRDGAYFVDDERSRRLLLGYAPAARELADQLAARGVEVGAACPLIVYLPCGVGGAPGGVTAGLKLIYGEHVSVVWVEPTVSACVMVALVGGGRARSVYELGLDNRTVADGLAVPKASQLVLDLVGDAIDAAVGATDAEMLRWVRRAHERRGLRLEPSAAAGLAGVLPFLRARTSEQERPPATATHVVWTTGGALLPDVEFEALVAPA